MALSPQWLDELKTRTTLSALIMRTTKLTRAGNEWKACCPFHNERTPSFYVNDAKGFYHCFGCQAHGSAIDWMMQQHGLEFMDAVKELAAAAGMDVPAPDPRAARRAEERASLHDVMQAAQDWLVANLRQPAGAKARDYLASRGFSDAICQEFGFGYAPDERQALKQALGKFEEPMLIEAGLRIAVDDKEPYDRFRDRLMLPIQDARGRVIAFGGRILEKREGAPKYLNSPDTPLFDKSRTLYNLHRAAPAARKSGRLIAVEGYMDVIALAAAGFAEAVAPMGTALTEQQIELMWRACEKPVLCFDGDVAGQRAAMKAVVRALPLLRPGHTLQIVTLPEGLDPDDLIRQRGKAAMGKLLEAPRSMIDLIWSHESAAAPLASPEDKAGLKARLLAHVDSIADTDIRALYRRELLDRYGAFAFPPREARSGNRTAWQGRPGQRPAAPARMDPQHATNLRKAAEGASRDVLTRAVLHGFLRHPELIAPHADSLFELASALPQVAPLVDHLVDSAESLEAGENLPIFDPDSVPPPPDNTRFSFLGEGSDPVEVREDLAEAVSLLVERPALEAAIKAATARFDADPEGAFAEQQLLRKRKLEIEERIGQMARKRAAAYAVETPTPDGAEPSEGASETE
ncbi:DNA primase [Aurantiacibacter flavus]|uniref:DNA primase n=1 Tax=Aurantiacibacter flavus TaxID=3145232 RepID=A0ABV0CUQ6_9SPHN